MTASFKAPTPDRRQILALGAAAALLPATPVWSDDKPIAETARGKVSGRLDRGIAAFKGIPYGRTTAGANRFRRSVAPAAWRGVRDAAGYGAQCPQVGILYTGIYASQQPAQPSSEDCLFLNVWTPKVGAGSRPVMVWLHGGGFESGSGSGVWYDGVNLATQGDVVVVTINHRLNVFGFAYLGEIGGERYKDSGFTGILDIVDALKWVKTNIAAFGGDPNNVTVFGESGGGRKISVLCATPEAKGLFHKGVIQSGSALRMRKRDDATANARRLLDHLGIAPNALGRLADVPTQTLLEAGLKASGATNASLPGATSFVPVIDGVNLHRDPFVPDAPSESRDVPLMIGWTRTETSRLIGARDASAFEVTDATLATKLATYTPADKVPALISAFRAANPGASASDIFFLITTGVGVRGEVDIQLDNRLKLGAAPTYAYCLEWNTPVDGGKWKAPHALDVPLVFDNAAQSASLTGPVTDDVKSLSADMSAAWIAFAKTGNPGTARLPWPAYDEAKRATMIFNTPSRVVDDAYGAERVAAATAITQRPGG